METCSALPALCEGNPLVVSPHKGKRRGTLMFSLICARTNGWANNRDAGDLRRQGAYCGVTVMNYAVWLVCCDINITCHINEYISSVELGYIRWYAKNCTLANHFVQIFKFNVVMDISNLLFYLWIAVALSSSIHHPICKWCKVY